MASSLEVEYELTIDEYKGIIAGKAFQVMIDNNLTLMALYPYSLLPSETGSVPKLIQYN